jgi:2-polyprenyl-3-methyl-5-hydroxy-6-metoxy-1,4-benzoquinol methylase
VDSNPVIVSNMTRLYPDRRFINRDVTEQVDELEGERFDTVVSLAVIEHLLEPEKLLENARRHLGDGGLLVITTPTPFGEKVHRLLERLSLAHPGIGERHHSVLTRKELGEIAGNTGFRVREHRLFEAGCNQLLVAERVPDGG